MLATILVVDDEPAIVRSLQRILTREKYSVTTAGDVTSARTALAAQCFDLIICDINLPGMSGLDLVRFARREQPDTAVMLITGGPTIESAIAAMNIGVARYLTKPFSTEVIVDAARFGVDLSRSTRDRRAATEVGTRVLEDHRALDSLNARFSEALTSIWMAYQPIVRLAEHSAIAYEALVRSREETLLRPEQLLGAAARLASEHRLGRTIRSACAHLPEDLPAGADLFVNILTSDLLDEDLYAAPAPLSTIAGRVVLEITERADLDSVANVKDRIRELRGLGYRIAVDDLGSGYSGLTSLSVLKPDIIKLDMFLIRDVHERPENARIIRGMLELARDLGAQLVCEGVETENELGKLLDLGCDLFQGYYFAKPAPTPPVVSWPKSR